MSTVNIKGARPKKVDNAVTILYVTLGIGALRSSIEGSANSEASGVGFTMFVTLAVLGFMLWLIVMIGRRRNWARVTFLILFLLGSIPAVQPLIRSLAISPVSGLLGVAQVVLQVVALVFLFQQEASDWFRHKATSESA